MSGKANFAIGSEELTVYFHIANGEPARCHYCEETGFEQLVAIENIEASSGPVSQNSKLFKDAKARMEREFFHGRGICSLGSPCEMRYIEERAESSDMVVAM